MSNEVFRFMTMRAPKKIEESEAEKKFIFYKEENKYATPSFLKILKNLRTTQKIIIRSSANFIKENAYIVSQNSYTINTLKLLFSFFNRKNASVSAKEVDEIIKYQKYAGKTRPEFDIPQQVTDLHTFLEYIDLLNKGTEFGYNLKDMLWQLYFAFCSNDKAEPSVRQELAEYIKTITILEIIDATTADQKDRQLNISALLNATLVLPSVFYRPTMAVNWSPKGSSRLLRSSKDIDENLLSTASVRAVGIAELKKVKQTLVGYEMGEVAHIENVLQSEKMERVYRTLNKTEEYTSLETATTNTEEKDTQSTDRFEIQREVAKDVATKTDVGVNLTVSASYGPTVKATLDTNFGYSNAVNESNKVSSTYAKETVNKAISRISEEIREKKSKTVLREIEETNTHGFDNTSGAGHISGVYRWVDKIYKMQVVNYGSKRMMYEFIVPEPAALYIQMQKGKKAVPNMDAPMPPMVGNRELKPSDITEENYIEWVRKYNVTGITLPPEKTIEKRVLFGFPRPNEENGAQLNGGPWNYILKSPTLEVPKGYIPQSGNVAIDCYCIANKENDSAWILMIGDQKIVKKLKETAPSHVFNFNISDTVEEVDTVPIMARTNNLWYFHAAINIHFRRSAQKLREWQLNTYLSIMEAYSALNDRYKEQLNIIDATSSRISGRNPAINKQLAQLEIKKGCLSLLKKRDLNYDYIDENNDFPEIDRSKLDDTGSELTYLEQVFEWENMTYVLYPYYYGRRKNWESTYNISDTDPEFEQFLKSGAARVVVPVRENFEQSLITYITTGKVWNGGPIPVISDDLYLSIISELKEQTNNENGEGEITDEWLVKVPTTLVKLQKTDELPNEQA